MSTKTTTKTIETFAVEYLYSPKYHLHCDDDNYNLYIEKNGSILCNNIKLLKIQSLSQEFSIDSYLDSTPYTISIGSTIVYEGIYHIGTNVFPIEYIPLKTIASEIVIYFNTQFPPSMLYMLKYALFITEEQYYEDDSELDPIELDWPYGSGILTFIGTDISGPDDGEFYHLPSSKRLVQNGLFIDILDDICKFKLPSNYNTSYKIHPIRRKYNALCVLMLNSANISVEQVEIQIKPNSTVLKLPLYVILDNCDSITNFKIKAHDTILIPTILMESHDKRINLTPLIKNAGLYCYGSCNYNEQLFVSNCNEGYILFNNLQPYTKYTISLSRSYFTCKIRTQFLARNKLLSSIFLSHPFIYHKSNSTSNLELEIDVDNLSQCSDSRPHTI